MDRLLRDIMRRHLWVSIAVLGFSLLFLVSYMWRVEAANVEPFFWLSAVYWLLYGGLIYWLRTGRTLKSNDPSLSLAFLALAVTYTSFSLYFAPENRDLGLLLYLVAIPYGVFQLNWQRFFLLAVYVMTAYLAVVSMVYTKYPAQWSWSQEVTLFGGLLFSLLFYVVLGKEVMVFRQRYEQKNRDLRNALQQIEELAITDELTGLYNRRYLMNMLDNQRTLVARENTTFVLIFIDLDHFKQINDQYGHAIGDQVLKELATLLKKSVREVDLVTRYGGEEFVVLLRDASINGALPRIERIRSQVNNRVFSNLQLSLTISAGVAEFRYPERIDELVSRADKLLYEAKRSGRNRVVSEPAPEQLVLAEEILPRF